MAKTVHQEILDWSVKSVTRRLSIYEVPSRRLRHNLEALLLRVFANESHNNELGKFR